jgi:hypothetical protein
MSASACEIDLAVRHSELAICLRASVQHTSSVGDDGEHPRRRLGLGRVDAPDPHSGDGGADQRGMRQAQEPYVIGIGRRLP